MAGRLRYIQQELTALEHHQRQQSSVGMRPIQTFVSPLASGDGFEGIVIVDSPTSPWFGGAFAFRIHVTPNYPGDCPTVIFDHPLAHPALDNGVLDVSHAYNDQQDPYRTSVLCRVVEQIEFLFEAQASAASGSGDLLEAAHRDICEHAATSGRFDEDAEAALALLGDQQAEWLLQARDYDAPGALDVPQVVTDRLMSDIVPKLRALR